MNGLRAADESHRTQSGAVLIDCLLRRCDDLAVVRQAQIVIRAEVQQLVGRAFDFDVRTLAGADHPFGLPGACLPNRFELGIETLADHLRQR